jgi:hypothetical protein
MSDDVGALLFPQAIATTAVDPSANVMSLRTFPPRPVLVAGTYAHATRIWKGHSPGQSLTLDLGILQ